MGTRITHGAWAVDSVFHVTQYEYGADDEYGTYTEVLVIHDPPVGKSGFVINRWTGGHFIFWEFKTLDDARRCAWVSDSGLDHVAERRVYCEDQSPWFYAGRLEDVEGDFARARLS